MNRVKNIVPLYTLNGKLHPVSVKLEFSNETVELSWEQFCSLYSEMHSVMTSINKNTHRIKAELNETFQDRPD